MITFTPEEKNKETKLSQKRLARFSSNLECGVQMVEKIFTANIFWQHNVKIVLLFFLSMYSLCGTLASKVTQHTTMWHDLFKIWNVG